MKQLLVTPLHTPTTSTDYVALQIEGKGFRDLVFASQDTPGDHSTMEFADYQGCWTFSLAALRWRSSAERSRNWRWQVGSELLVQADGDKVGTVTSAGRKADGATGDYFDVTGVLPHGAALAGRVLVLTAGDGTAHAYRIAEVANHGSSSRVFVHDDPGVIITEKGMKQLFFPNWEIAGSIKYHILGRGQITLPQL